MSGSEGREDAAESAASIYLCPMPDDVSEKHVTVATPAVTAIILPLHVLLSVDYTTVCRTPSAPTVSESLLAVVASSPYPTIHEICSMGTATWTECLFQFKVDVHARQYQATNDIRRWSWPKGHELRSSIRSSVHQNVFSVVSTHGDLVKAMHDDHDDDTSGMQRK